MDKLESSVMTTQQHTTERRHPNEYGFYIACDDRSILRCVNSMLLNKGILGLSDSDGRVHYLIDGRRGGSYVVDQMSRRLQEVSLEQKEDTLLDDIFVSHAIEAVIDKFELDPKLVGTQILHTILRELYYEPKLIKGVSKTLYPRIGQIFSMNNAQVERNLRYAIHKSRLGREKRVLAAIRDLRDAMLEEIYQSYGRILPEKV